MGIDLSLYYTVKGLLELLGKGYILSADKRGESLGQPNDSSAGFSNHLFLNSTEGQPRIPRSRLMLVGKLYRYLS